MGSAAAIVGLPLGNAQHFADDAEIEIEKERAVEKDRSPSPSARVALELPAADGQIRDALGFHLLAGHLGKHLRMAFHDGGVRFRQAG